MSMSKQNSYWEENDDDTHCIMAAVEARSVAVEDG